MATKKSGRVKLPKRMWRKDKPQVRATPTEYTDEMYKRAFGHDFKLNVMDRRWWKYDLKTLEYYCYKCNAQIDSALTQCPNCKAEAK